jgi:CRISPR-associated protein Csm4
MEYTVKLNPESPFHIGEAGIGLEETSYTVHSDTLFSAICNTYALLYGKDEIEHLLDQFEREPPFILSSTFLFIEDILTFPVPLNVNWSKFMDKSQFKKENSYEIVKRMKKVQFCSEKMLHSILKDEQNIFSNDLNIKNNILFSPEEPSPDEIYSVIEAPHVALDRRSQFSSIYHIGEVHYASACGLYFFLKTESEYDSRLKAAIHLLGDEGLGGKRSSGKGLFKPVFLSEICKIPQSPMNITLSLIFPNQEELSIIKEGSYKIVMRKGWIYSPRIRSLRKKSVRMLTEGSTFPRKVKGQMVDVTPDVEFKIPQIMRYGYGFYLEKGGEQ